jgi:divalent metal cation (Fe/Co/Zn/Cd) transporter
MSLPVCFCGFYSHMNLNATRIISYILPAMQVAIFLIQRNRQALLGRSIDDLDMRRVINLLISDPVVEGLYDCKSEVIGPGAYRFKAEIDFNGVAIVQNYLQRAGRDAWMKDVGSSSF